MTAECAHPADTAAILYRLNGFTVENVFFTGISYEI
jgi:hypothetical protein